LGSVENECLSAKLKLQNEASASRGVAPSGNAAPFRKWSRVEPAPVERSETFYRAGQWDKA